MKKETRKILIAAVVVLVLLAALAGGVWLATRPAVSEGAKTITVEVVHKDESTKTFTYHTDEEYLGPVLVNEGLVEGENSEYGLMITVVDGESAIYAENGAYWAFYVGDEYASLGVDSTPIADGDSFSLVYTIG